MNHPGFRTLCIGLWILAAPATALPAYLLQYQAVLPGPGGVETLDRPAGVTVDPVSQEVCVTDAGGVGLNVYNPLGVHVFRTGPIAGLVSPDDGTVEVWGGLVCTDIGPDGRRTIKRLNFLGEPVPYDPEPPSPEWTPSHLLVTRDGDYVTVDNRSGTLSKHDSETGRLLWSRPAATGPADGDAFFGRPAEASDGRIFLPGGELHRMFVFSADGEPLGSFGKPGTARGELAVPVGVAFGVLDHVLVLDRMRHTVLLYDQELRFVREFGTMGSGKGNFYHPVAIAALSDGRIWVAQGFQGRVQAFRLFDAGGAETMQSKAAS